MALALALAAARAGMSTMAADLDPARDLGGRLRVRFEDPEAPWDVLDLPRGLSIRYPTPEGFDRAVAAVLAQDVTDLLILDTAFGVGAAAEDVLSATDLALVPVRADPLALRAAQATATRLLHLRVNFTLVAVGQDADRAVSALRQIGPVAGTILDPDALFREVTRKLAGQPPVPTAAIVQARLDCREARRVERDASPSRRSTARRTVADRLRPAEAA